MGLLLGQEGGPSQATGGLVGDANAGEAGKLEDAQATYLGSCKCHASPTLLHMHQSYRVLCPNTLSALLRPLQCRISVGRFVQQRSYFQARRKLSHPRPGASGKHKSTPREKNNPELSSRYCLNPSGKGLVWDISGIPELEAISREPAPGSTSCHSD